jgi:hypothetical protein
MGLGGKIESILVHIPIDPRPQSKGSCTNAFEGQDVTRFGFVISNLG